MAQMIEMGECDGAPEWKCSNCDVIFLVIWNNNGYTKSFGYCPFCGDEVDGFESESDRCDQ